MRGGSFFRSVFPLSIAILVILTATTVHGEIYKWRDASGKLRFSDKPPSQDAKPDQPTGRSGLSVVDQKLPEVAGFKRSYKAGRNGHFEITAKVNGTPVTFMADTGASVVALNWSTAKKIGLTKKELKFIIPVNTANGQVMAAPVLVDLAIGSLRLNNVRASVSKAAQKKNLLGMSFFSRLKRFQSQKGVMTIEWEPGQTR